jgi:hypothetical protein
MPPLNQMTGLDLAQMGYAPVTNAGAAGPPPDSNQQPTRNAFMRCPFPPIATASPDSLRQFYTNGVVPQNRIYNPGPIAGTGVGSGGSANVTVSSSSSTNTTVTSTLAISSAFLKTPSLLPGAKFIGQVSMSKAFQLLVASASGPVRIELYGTGNAQTLDSYRGLDIPPPAGTFQNLICDIALDTAPYQWNFQDRFGINADSPQAPIAYITITNLSGSPASLMVTLSYIQLV